MTLRSLTRDEVRSIDAQAVRELGILGLVLMENAGRGAAERLVAESISGRVVICAGKGNNGGDGFVIARHLANQGFDVQTLFFCDPATLATGDDAGPPSDYLVNFRVLQAAGEPVEVIPPDCADLARLDSVLVDADWVVDALLGTGTQGAIRPTTARLIDRINAAGRKTLAIDLPSGLDCETGLPLGSCIRATRTVTFVARKVGFDNPDSVAWTGPVDVVGIGVPHRWLERVLAE
jgi:NAD(P)H-hydrate epimerase